MTLRNDMICVYVVRPDHDGRSHEILQIQRGPGRYMEGVWTTVYGSALEGETAVQAALRELKEETSLTPAEFYRLSIAPAFYTDYNDTTYVVPAFCALVTRDAVVTLNVEHQAMRWISRRDAENQFLWESERHAIASLGRDILDNSPARAYLKIL